MSSKESGTGKPIRAVDLRLHGGLYAHWVTVPTDMTDEQIEQLRQREYRPSRVDIEDGTEHVRSVALSPEQMNIYDCLDEVEREQQ